MAGGLLKDKSLPALMLFILIGIIIGSFLSSIIAMMPGSSSNVVKTFFTYPITFGIGDFVNNKPLLIDLSAIKFQLGFQIKFSFLSLIGLFVGLYLFRWYR